jgi:hypothetical protein
VLPPIGKPTGGNPELASVRLTIHLLEPIVHLVNLLLDSVRSAVQRFALAAASSWSAMARYSSTVDLTSTFSQVDGA